MGSGPRDARIGRTPLLTTEMHQCELMSVQRAGPHRLERLLTKFTAIAS
jgi:hypothetical protein